MEKFEFNVEIPVSERENHCFAPCPQHVVNSGHCKCSNEILSKLANDKKQKEKNNK